MQWTPMNLPWNLCPTWKWKSDAFFYCFNVYYSYITDSFSLIFDYSTVLYVKALSFYPNKFYYQQQSLSLSYLIIFCKMVRYFNSCWTCEGSSILLHQKPVTAWNWSIMEMVIAQNPYCTATLVSASISLNCKKPDLKTKQLNTFFRNAIHWSYTVVLSVRSGRGNYSSHRLITCSLIGTGTAAMARLDRIWHSHDIGFITKYNL